ncbi:MAG: iron-sulfur cluster assembly scaffold protein [Candidatus Lokiarchaeota archaeon]|nr:iron-sulfur cluster assembly scaffold protein [Candidatus Lokiarchaeota archaeon]
MSKDDFDEFVNKLQKEIIDKELKDYNERIVELYHNPINWGQPPEEEITETHAYEGPCGDTMQFFLKIKNNKIEKANFITDGCGATVACGSQTTMLIEGRSLEFAENLKSKDIEKALNGLPEDHKHCAELAKRTLRRLIEKYKYKKN